MNDQHFTVLVKNTLSGQVLESIDCASEAECEEAEELLSSKWVFAIERRELVGDYQ
jgi:hypothetical protein